MSDLSFSEYIINKGEFLTSTVFHPSDSLPIDFIVTTPFTFPIQKKLVHLCLDKSGWWNPLGGHIELGETWEDALIREAKEEAGVEIRDIKISGYVLAKQLQPNNKYPDMSILPITTSTVAQYRSSWNAMETKGRGRFSFDDALAKFKQRQDNNQMFEIFRYIIKTT